MPMYAAAISTLSAPVTTAVRGIDSFDDADGGLISRPLRRASTAMRVHRPARVATREGRTTRRDGQRARRESTSAV
jgi:hypothetical protein